MDVIRTTHLTKHFGSTTATDDISIHVKAGEIYGFLGLNGAGKTTLIRILLGMIKPDRGSVRLFDKDLQSGFNQWNDIGYLVETPYSYPNLSVRENLQVYHKLRQLNGSHHIDHIIEKLKLTPYKNTKANVLSLGNQQRLGLAKALLHQPRLLILDEPINGLDPEGIVEVRNLLKELSQGGTTIFLSSHILGEISKVADRIGIIHGGKLIKEVTIQELEHQLIKKIIIQTNDNKKAAEELQSKAHHVTIVDDTIELTNREALSHPEDISMLLANVGVPPKQLFVFTEDLETYFLRTIRPN